MSWKKICSNCSKENVFEKVWRGDICTVDPLPKDDEDGNCTEFVLKWRPSHDSLGIRHHEV